MIPSHEVHFLTLTVAGSRRGWVAPLELPKGNQEAATHVVPVQPKGGLFPQYRVELARCLARGGYTSVSSVLRLQPDGFLEAIIDGRALRFQLRCELGQPNAFEYVGALTHPDFSLPLAEIVPEDEDQLADLYARERIVIVGCDPLPAYGGAGALPQTVPPQAS